MKPREKTVESVDPVDSEAACIVDRLLKIRSVKSVDIVKSGGRCSFIVVRKDGTVKVFCPSEFDTN